MKNEVKEKSRSIHSDGWFLFRHVKEKFMIKKVVIEIGLLLLANSYY